MRILINGLRSKAGGGLTYLRNVLPLLNADESLDVHLCLHDDQDASFADGLDRITVHRLSFVDDGFLRQMWAEQTAVPRLARHIAADVVFSPANYGPLWVPGGVILLRNATGVLWRERRVSKWLYWIAVWVLTALSLWRAKKAVAVSDYARRTLALPGLRDKVTVVAHGRSTAFKPPAKRAKRKGFALAVSDIYVQKNFTALIRAFAALRETHPDLTLKIAGRPIDRDYYAQLWRLVDDLGLGDAVDFLGSVDGAALAKLYKTCAVFVFPSTVETFGNPLVEAMASGAPIACSATAAMPEVVGGAAILFAPDSIDSMAEAIRRVLDDKDLAKALSERAVARAEAFSWEKTAAETVAVLRQATLR